MQNQARMLMECKNKQILNSCFKKLEKIKKNVKNDDFWQDLLVFTTLPWQRQMLWSHGYHIKISAKDEWTATESFSIVG